MFLSSADVIAAVLSELPPDLRAVVEARYLDGDTLPNIMRRCQMKRRDLVGRLEAALTAMRATLRLRGIRRIADVL